MVALHLDAVRGHAEVEARKLERHGIVGLRRRGRIHHDPAGRPVHGVDDPHDGRPDRHLRGDAERGGLRRLDLVDGGQVGPAHVRNSRISRLPLLSRKSPAEYEAPTTTGGGDPWPQRYSPSARFPTMSFFWSADSGDPRVGKHEVHADRPDAPVLDQVLRHGGKIDPAPGHVADLLDGDRVDVHVDDPDRHVDGAAVAEPPVDDPVLHKFQESQVREDAPDQTGWGRGAASAAGRALTFSGMPRGRTLVSAAPQSKQKGGGPVRSN